MRPLSPLLLLTFSLAIARAEDTGVAPPPEPAGLRGWYGLPVVFYTPETKLAYGALGGVHFGWKPALPSSSLEVLAYGTTTGQATARATFQAFPSARLAASGEVRIQEAPDFFYGLGPDAPASAEEAFTSRMASFVVQPELRVGAGRLRIGPRLHVHRERLVERARGGALEAGAVPGTDPFTAVGVGAGATWDDRDDLFQPTRGRFVLATATAYPRASGTAAFARANVDARAFAALGRGHVLAATAWLDASFGDAPMTLLPKLGGGNRLRGVREGRYRGDRAWTVAVEERFPIAGRLRGAVFAGAGAVAERGAWGAPRPAGGAGLRFRLTDTGAVVRGDVAVGAGLQLYLVTLEAF